MVLTYSNKFEKMLLYVIWVYIGGWVGLTYNNKNGKSVIICQFGYTSGVRVVLTYSNEFGKSVIICQFGRTSGDRWF